MKQANIYILLLVVIVLKLILLPFAQTVDADAVSRIFLSISWTDNPHWIMTSVWAPFHFYLNGLGLLIWNNPIYLPKLINILFSSFTLIPFYYFTKREFNKNGAFIACIFLAISPILFRNGFLALSETPYLFFLSLCINLLSKAIREHSYKYILLAGLSITIASGFRYEAWLIIAVFGLILCLNQKWKLFMAFNITALLFPLSWLITNWYATGNALYGIQGNYHWTLDMMGNNDNLELESHLRRIWFFPFSWLIALGPPVAYLVLKNMYKGFKLRPFNKKALVLSIPFIILFFFFQYNAFKGVLLLQHRFVGTLVILSLPFVAIYYHDLNSKKIKSVFLFSGLTIALSFVYNTNGIIPLPRLQDQRAVEISQLIAKKSTDNSCLIIDFIGWENSYFIALNSKLKQENFVIIGGAKNSKVPYQEINDKFKKYNNGIILLKKDSELYHEFVSNNLNLDEYHLQSEVIYQNNNLIMYRIK